VVIIYYLEPLEQFICDECGEIIAKPEDGEVEWISYYEDSGSDDRIKIIHEYRLVHNSDSSPKGKGTCFYDDLYGTDYKGICNNLTLDDFIKDKGLARMLAVLRDRENGYVKFKTKRDYLNFVELIRRISIPYYEESTLYLERYYEEYTGESDIIYRRLDREELKKFLDWIDEKDYNYNL